MLTLYILNLINLLKQFAGTILSHGTVNYLPSGAPFPDVQRFNS